MLLGTEPSQFRVEKTKTDAVILLSDGESVRGYFFVAHASPRSSGPELVGERNRNRHDHDASDPLDDAGRPWRGHGRPERCPDGARDEKIVAPDQAYAKAVDTTGFEALLKRAGLDARPRPQPAAV
jgi:hypothetical protein